jgi:hypothetical protein
VGNRSANAAFTFCVFIANLGLKLMIKKRAKVVIIFDKNQFLSTAVFSLVARRQ